MQVKRLRGIIWTAVSTASQADEDERASMGNQEADLRAFFEKEGIEIVDVLRVPGHSRNYKSLDALAAHARKEGIDAFDKLIQHLEAGDFDVIGVRDANRFARRASLLHYIAESIVEDCGAKIYSLSDGWVDSSNVDVWAMVKGYETNKQRKWISGELNRGKDKLAEKGLPEGRVLWTHTLIRNPKTGKAIGMVINEEMRPITNDMATLILKGVPWHQLGIELYRQFGHVSPRDGKPFNGRSLYSLLHSPTFWGHRARHVRENSGGYGAWAFDEHVLLPSGVQMYRDVLPAVYTGALGEAIKAELRRRMTLRGRARPATTYRYSNLFVCGHCGKKMSAHSQRNVYYGMRCVGPAIYVREGGTICNQYRYTKQRHLDTVINSILLDYIEGRTPAILESEKQPQPDTASVAAEIQTLDRKIDTLIYEQSQQPADAQPYYRRSIAQMVERLEILKAQLTETTREMSAQVEAESRQKHAIDAIREMTLDTFWKLPEREINQLLHQVIYSKRLVVRDRKVVGSRDR